MPDFANYLRRIHRVITRAIQVGLETSTQRRDIGFTDELSREGFYQYMHTLVNLLHSHHTGEDTISFPEMELRVPTAPVKQLCAEHEEMQVILDRISQVLALTSSGTDDRVILASLSQEIALLNEVWNRHIHLEEDVFSAKRLHEAFQKYETDAMNQKLAEHGQKESGPDYLLLPFVLYNLSVEDRVEMAQVFPPVVVQELVPKVWKDKWALMKPYLLD